MTGTAIAAGLLLAVLACALGFLPLRNALTGAAIAAVTTVVVALVVEPPALEIALAGCWTSLGIAALSVFWPRSARRWVIPAMVFCAVAGFWAGMLLGQPEAGSWAIATVAVLLLLLPAMICVKRGWPIAPRILTSWLLAVALLAGTIPFLVEHPGNVPDHRM